MKIYLSADIEGITGVTHWDETELDKADSTAAREQMTAEVAAACEGAIESGATEIWVQDVHDSGRNIIAAQLPPQARLIRGWSGHPFKTLQALDKTCAAVMLIGYHSGAGAGRSPLEHTYSGHVMCIKLNGSYVSEFSLDALTCALVGVPLVFVSGDQGLCDQVALFNAQIKTVAVKQGSGGSTINVHPNLATSMIRQGAAQSLQSDLDLCRTVLPEHFRLEVRYRSHVRAYQYSFFPGVRQTDIFTVQLDTDNYFDVLRFLLFAV